MAKPRKGQVYRDLDPRGGPRFIRVIDHPVPGIVHVENATTSRKSTVRVDRLKTHFELVKGKTKR